MIRLILVIHFLLFVSIFSQLKHDELFLKVEVKMNRAKLDNADVLYANLYSKAVEEYRIANRLASEGASPVDIREKLVSSISYLNKMNGSIGEKNKVFASTIAKRNSALDSGADKNVPYYWELGEKAFQEAIENFDDNEITSVLEGIKATNEYYSTAKLYSNKANSLINDSKSFINATSKLAYLIAPISYEKAEDKMFETLNLISSGERIDEIDKSITNTKFLFDLASVNASKYLAVYSELLDTRKDAKIVDAEKYTIEIWEKAEDLLKESAEDFEKKDYDESAELATEADLNYNLAKQISLKDYYLNDTKNEISLAIDEGAEKYAPKTLKLSQDYLNEATNLIESNSYSLKAIKELADNSYRSAITARRITEIAKRMKPSDQSWEDIILDQKTELLGDINVRLPKLPVRNFKADNNYSYLTEKLETTIGDEADITVAAGKIILQLKNVNFPMMSSRLNNNSKVSLEKIIEVLKKVSFSEATIISYTDNAGTKSINLELSERRAETILNYILKKDNSHKYFIKGMGEEKPITSNYTLGDRRKNNRIEIVIKK